VQLRDPLTTALQPGRPGNNGYGLGVAAELEKALAKIKGRPGSIAGRPGGCRADWESMSVPFARANDISHQLVANQLTKLVPKTFPFYFYFVAEQ
jgi:hypothetical protein